MSGQTGRRSPFRPPYQQKCGKTLSNTILANVPSADNCSETITDEGYNISDDGSCEFSESTSKNDTGPKLASSLGNNGDPT